jgi:hypothetical protein
MGRLIRSQRRNARGQIFGIVAAFTIVFCGIAVFALFGNESIAIYYHRKLEHVAAIASQAASLNCSPTWYMVNKPATQQVVVDTLKLMNLPSWSSQMGLGVSYNQSFAPCTVSITSPVPIMGDTDWLKFGQWMVTGTSASPYNSQVGYLAVPYDNVDQPDPPTIVAGAPPLNSCQTCSESASNSLQQICLPIVKAPPVGTGTPTGSWYLQGTHYPGSDYTSQANLLVPVSGFAVMPSTMLKINKLTPPAP